MIRAARIAWVFIVTSIWLAAASCVFWDKPPTTAPPDYTNMSCRIGIKVDGHPWCYKIVWTI